MSEYLILMQRGDDEDNRHYETVDAENADQAESRILEDFPESSCIAVYVRCR